MMRDSNGQPDRGNWERYVSALASEIASRHIGLAERLRGHGTSPAKTTATGIGRGALTLARHVSKKAGWSNSLAGRVGGLSCSISRSRQASDFPVEPSPLVWSRRERAIGSRFQDDRAMPYTEFQEMPYRPEATDASSPEAWQQEGTERFSGQSPNVYEAQDERRTGTTAPMLRAIAEGQQHSRSKAAEFATAHRAKIQRLPAMAPSGPLLQGKGILSSESPAKDESVSMPSSEFRLPQKPPIAKASDSALGAEHQLSAIEGELGLSPDATAGSGEGAAGPALAGEGATDIPQKHHGKEASSSSPAETGSEAVPMGSVGKSQPGHERAMALTPKRPSIALSSSSMGLFSKRSMTPGISPIASPRALSFQPTILALRKSLALPDEQSRTTEVQASLPQEGVFSPTSPGERPSTSPPERSSAPPSARRISAPTGEGLAETVAAKYQPGTEGGLTAGPLSLVQPFTAARSWERGSESRPAESPSEGLVRGGATVSPASEALSLIQRSAMARPRETSASRGSERTMGRGLSEEVAEKYGLGESITPFLASEPVSPVEPLVAAKFHEAPTKGESPLEEEVVFDYPPQKHGMPSRERAGEYGIASPSDLFSSSEARTIRREVYGREAPHEEADVWSLPTLVPPRTAAPGGIFRAYEPVEPILARFADRPYRETVDHGMVTAPIQRTESLESISGISRAEGEGEERETEDFEELASRVYPIIKRRLEVERERMGCR